MKSTSIFALTGGLLAAFGGIALADPDPGAPAPAPAMGVTVAPAAGAGLEYAPLVAPMGKLDIHGTLPIVAVTASFTDPTTGATTSDTETDTALVIGADYGIADKLEGGIEYGHGISPSAGNGALGAHLAFAALHQDKLDVAAAVSITLGLDSGAPDTLGLGLWARYHVAPKLTIFTGNPGLPHSAGIGGLVDPNSLNFAGGTYQLGIGLNNGQPAVLSVPVGVGFQATPELYAFAATTVAAFSLHDGANEFIFSDVIPLNIGAFYQVNPKLDVGAEFSDDLKNAGDFYIFSLSARYWVK